MNFQEANNVLYRGYLYMLIAMIAGFVAYFIAVTATLSALLFPFPGGPAFNLLAALAVVVGGGLAILAAAVVIFLKFHFRGYMALHRLGIKWAWWMAWGPIIYAILAAVYLAGVAIFPGAIVGLFQAGLPTWAGTAAAATIALPLLIIQYVIFAFAILLFILKILFLRHMHSYTGLSLFQTAWVMYLATAIILLIPYVNLLAGVLGLITYIIEMLAYKDATSWRPKEASPPT